MAQIKVTQVKEEDIEKINEAIKDSPLDNMVVGILLEINTKINMIASVMGIQFVKKDESKIIKPQMKIVPK